jgi:hypothetical protein
LSLQTGSTAYDLASKEFKDLLNPETTTTKLTIKQAIDNGDVGVLRTLLSAGGKINLPIDYVLFLTQLFTF